MKKLLLPLFAGLIASASLAQPHVIARNHLGSTTFYYPAVDNELALQLVIDDASTGDTIYLPGVTYTLMDDVVLDKQLVIVGTGVLSDNAQAYNGTTLLNTNVGVNFIMELGADGAELHGIDFTGGNLEVNFGVNQAGTNVDDIHIERCRFNYLYLGFQATGSLTTNVHITNCVIENLRVYQAQNIHVKGSIIGNGGLRYASGNCFVENCIFLNTDLSSAPLGVANQDVTYTNNIFTRSTSFGFSITESSSFFNNLVIVSTGGFNGFNGVDADVNNAFEPDVTQVFINADLVSWLPTEDYHLTGPPFTTMGTGGSQVGIYGSAATWKPGLLPFNPHWILLQLGSPSTTNGLLNSVHFKASAQQDGVGGPFKISAIRYWWGNLPNPPLGSNMRYVDLPTPIASLDTTLDLEFCDFPSGVDQWIMFQLLDDHGQWSSVIVRQVDITQAGAPNVVSSITQSGIYCPGDQVTFTANHNVVVPNGAPTSFTWTTPAGWLYTPSTSNTIVVTIGNTPGVLSVTANNYCGSSAPYQISINPIQPAVLTSVSGLSTICANSTGAIFTTQTFSGTYHWSAPPGWSFSPPIPTGSSATAVPGPGAQSGNITVYVTNQCGDNSNTVSLPVSIAPLPGAASMVGTWPTEACTGTSLTFDINAAVNATGYMWDDPWMGPIGGGLSQTSTVGGADGTVSVTPTNNCGDGPVLSISFDALQAPGTPSFALLNDTVCAGDTVLFEVNNDPTADYYDWTYPSTGWTWSDDSSNVITGITGVGAADGTILVSAVNGCGSSAADMDVTVVDPLVLGPITGSSAVPLGAVVPYSVNSIAEASGYEWQFPTGWSFDTSDADQTDTLAILVAGIGGVDSICVRAVAADCVGEQVCMDISTSTGGVNMAWPAAMVVIPNPSNGQFTLDLGEAHNGPAPILVLDAAGRVVHTALISSTSTQLDLGELSNGGYTLECQAVGIVLRTRIVIQR